MIQDAHRCSKSCSYFKHNWIIYWESTNRESDWFEEKILYEKKIWKYNNDLNRWNELQHSYAMTIYVRWIHCCRVFFLFFLCSFVLAFDFDWCIWTNTTHAHQLTFCRWQWFTLTLLSRRVKVNWYPAVEWNNANASWNIFWNGYFPFKSTD